MDKREELDAFLGRADEFLDSKYILADVKIVNLLKSIAASETLLAIFKNCLADFDYEKAKKKYLVVSPLSSGKGEFVPPTAPGEFLAFVFNIFMDIDSKEINFGEFLDKYFYVDGSSYSGYNAFLESVVKPFRQTVKTLMEEVIGGKLQDPVVALSEEDARREKEKAEKEKQAKKEAELSKQSSVESLKSLRSILVVDKKKVKESKLDGVEKHDLLLVIDMLASVVEGKDVDAMEYAFIAYRYACKAHKMLFLGRVKKVAKLLGEVINGL